MVLKKAFLVIKQFILKLLIYFLPRPDSAPDGAEVVTEKGVRKIVRKLFRFLIAGLFLADLLTVLRLTGVLNAFEISIDTGGLADPVWSLSLPEGMLLSLTLIYYGIMPFLRYMYRWLPVTGVIYAMSAGFILACGMGLIKMHLIGIVLLSMAGTAILSLLPLYLLKYRKLQLPRNLACITYVSFAVITLGGSVLNVLNLIPYICNVTGILIALSDNAGIIIAIDGIKVIVAFLFMFLAYNRVSDYSRRHVSREYEWLVAFTGFYTVLLIVIKIFEMLVFIIN